jgi:hypothetical protein
MRRDVFDITTDIHYTVPYKGVYSTRAIQGKIVAIGGRRSLYLTQQIY